MIRIYKCWENNKHRYRVEVWLEEEILIASFLTRYAALYFARSQYPFIEDIRYE